MNKDRAGTRALRKVISTIQIPKGIGSFDEAWEIVSEADEALVAAIAACDEDDTPENRDAVRRAAREWKMRWTEAIARFEESG